MNKDAIQKGIFAVIILSLMLWNENIMPIRREMTEIELVKTAGLDKSSDPKFKYDEVIVRPKQQATQSGGSGGSQGGGSSKETQKVFTVRCQTFSEGIRSFQTYLDKNLPGSHIKVFILGEEFCKNEMSLGMDFNARDYEVRLNIGIYIAKGSSAKDFIEKTVNGEYELSDKILSMEKNNDAKNISYKTTILDVLKILSNKEGVGLIPTLKIISPKGDKGFELTGETDQPNEVNKTDNNETFFDFDGYGVIKDDKLIGYLDREQSITANLIMNRHAGMNIDIEADDGGMYSFGLIKAERSFKFNFNDDKLSEIVINVNLETNIDEVATKENDINAELIKKLEQKQSDKIKKQMEDVIQKMKEYKCDFLNLKDDFRIQHPFKYEKMKDNITDILCNTKVTVNVKTGIKSTYDIVGINKEE